ncbi:MAG TPA: hypothetical protein PLK61_11760, partial [Nitrosomonas sp.]|nr:hypothetical protein [Nitrosomonas sp.]
DGRYIAADGRESMSSTIVRDDADKFYWRGHELFALCGKTPHCKQFATEFSVDKKPSDETNECGGFLFDGNEVFMCFIDEDLKTYSKCKISIYRWADGSGRNWAIAALDHGKSAIEAVKYAMIRDKHSGGTIRCFDTKTKQFVKVKQ